jgi:hypothetical protein
MIIITDARCSVTQEDTAVLEPVAATVAPTAGAGASKPNVQQVRLNLLLILLDSFAQSECCSLCSRRPPRGSPRTPPPRSIRSVGRRGGHAFARGTYKGSAEVVSLLWEWDSTEGLLLLPWIFEPVDTYEGVRMVL